MVELGSIKIFQLLIWKFRKITKLVLLKTRMSIKEFL